MALHAISLRISAPIEPIQPGRGFYQLDEDSLYVQVGLFSRDHRFFSYLESDCMRFDIDREGRLIFIEVPIPRKQWPVNPQLEKPTTTSIADIRWLDFRERISDPLLSTNTEQTTLYLQFNRNTPVQCYYLAESVLLQVDKNKLLTAIWINDISDDFAGRELSAFRRECRTDVVHSC